MFTGYPDCRSPVDADFGGSLKNHSRSELEINERAAAFLAEYDHEQQQRPDNAQQPPGHFAGYRQHSGIPHQPVKAYQANGNDSNLDNGQC